MRLCTDKPDEFWSQVWACRSVISQAAQQHRVDTKLLEDQVAREFVAHSFVSYAEQDEKRRLLQLKKLEQALAGWTQGDQLPTAEAVDDQLMLGCELGITMKLKELQRLSLQQHQRHGEAMARELLKKEALSNTAHRNELNHLVDKHSHEIFLNPGELIIIDNRRSVHGRISFKPYYDGYDRWLKRSYVTRDLKTAEILFSNKKRIIDYEF